MNSYVVIGLGRFGSKLAETLYGLKKDVLAIDLNEDSINTIADKVTRAVVADGKDIEVLKRLGVGDADCAIVAMGSDLATSVLTTMNLKKLGVKTVVCKAHDETHREILEKIGADKTIFPERDMAVKLADSFATPNILEQIELSKEYGIVECTAPQRWTGKAFKELDIRTKYAVNIIAVKDGESVKISPPSSYIIKENSVLLLLGKYEDLEIVKSIK